MDGGTVLGKQRGGEKIMMDEWLAGRVIHSP